MKQYIEKEYDSEGNLLYVSIFKDKKMTKLHSYNGEPAFIVYDGTTIWKEIWYKNGLLHREDEPAILWYDGYFEWYKNGLRHREDGPAILWSDGYFEWYKNGLRHREDGPACLFGGCEKFYLNGQYVTKYDVMGKSEPILKVNGVTLDGAVMHINGLEYKLSIVE